MNFVHALAIDMESERERPAEKLRNKEKQNERRHSLSFRSKYLWFLYDSTLLSNVLAVKKDT